MADDPLAQYRKTPVSSGSTGSHLPPAARDEYEAFAGKDRVNRLRIRSLSEPVNALDYKILLNVIYDKEGTSVMLVFTILSVLVQGRNLQAVIFAIENDQADFIQEFDPSQWPKPKDASAPFIQSITFPSEKGKQ